MTRPKSATVDIRLRMEKPLCDRLKAAAAENGVSVNAEAIKRLEKTLTMDALFEQLTGQPLNLKEKK